MGGHSLVVTPAQAEYRFRVVASVAYGTSASGWAVATAAGVPEKMEPVRHLLSLGFLQFPYAWTKAGWREEVTFSYFIQSLESCTLGCCAAKIKKLGLG